MNPRFPCAPIFLLLCAVGYRRFLVTATIGIAFATPGSTSLTLLSDADAALYLAKDQDRNRYGVFDDEVRDRMVARLHMEADLREVLDRRELLAYYQPVFSAATGEAVGAEALARWPHPELGFMPPRSEEHTSELQSLMRNSYAVVCLKKKNITRQQY